MKNWKVLPAVSEEVKAKFPELNPIILQLLYNRGLDTQEKIDEFLNPEYDTHINDPYLFKDMSKVVGRIFLALKNGEKIVVHGDYDADGVTSSVVMMSALTKIMETFGQKEKTKDLLSIFIPHREKDGYGLKMSTVKEFIKQKINLVITVDCGISCAAEIEALKKEGIDTIVTDHHQEPLKLPDQAFAIICSSLKSDNYPCKVLSGAGVAFKVVQALFKKAKELKPEENWEGAEKWLLDIVAIGTVADIVPLIGENRTLTKYGLVVLNKTPRLGLRALCAVAGIGGNNGSGNGWRDLLPKKGLNTYSINFQLAPRLNAAGRMDHANTAYALLMTGDEMEAESLAESIQNSNYQRQDLTEKIVNEVKELITEQNKSGEKILMALGQDWPTGVVGLVAGKVADSFYKPVMVCSLFDGKLVGSGRSVEGFNLIAAMQKLDRLFLNYGGHPMACGFTLKDTNGFPEFKQELQKIGREEIKNEDLVSSCEVEAAITLEDASWGLYDELEKMEPFGEGNPKPLFAVYGVDVDAVDFLGKDKKHLKILVKQKNGMLRKLIGFGYAEGFKHLRRGDKIDVLMEIDINEWNGNRELQLKIVDLKKI